jgi:hypothetical protein
MRKKVMPRAAGSGPAARQKKFFTVESANKMLPLVRSIAGDIVQKFRELGELRERLELLQGTRAKGLTAAHREEVEEVEREFERAKDNVAELVEELGELGVELKGPDGLVDFPAIMDGREVYLCWKLDEPGVMFWHERDAGFAGRQQLTAESGSKLTPF